MDVEGLARDIVVGNLRAVARGITIVENVLPEKETLIRHIFPHTGRAVKLGITGAPGSGKSTLVDKLIRSYRKKGNKVGIIAVDPSSPFTRGAILGDRLRMQDHSIDPGVFIRSMASRGHLGGLSSGCWDAVKILDAAGFDPIIIETIGVGQTEVEIMKLSDLILLVLVPGLGDEIQALKAGVMEIGDVYVINKADLEGADKLKTEVEYALNLNHGNEERGEQSGSRSVVMTSAKYNEGVGELVAVMDGLIEKNRKSSLFKERRKRVCTEELARLIQGKLTQLLETHVATAQTMDLWAEAILSGNQDPYTIIREYVTPRIRLED